MGGSSSKKKKISKIVIERNKKIENYIEKDFEEKQKEVKILVLGTGESGKTTLIKQMMILFQKGFGDDDRDSYFIAIRQNVILFSIALISIVETLNIKVLDETREIFRQIEKLDKDDLDETSGKLIQKIWADSGLKEAFSRRSQFQVPDSTSYFLDEVIRISDSNYVPSTKDMLYCRIPTTGVNYIKFIHAETPWLVVDVGGQRSERKKWIHQFDDVDTLIFVIAINEFDQTLYEDSSVNRMIESLTLFEQTVNNDFFKKKNCIILFNKMDLFYEKIISQDPSITFPDYQDGNDPEKAKEFIKSKFISVAENLDRKIFCQYTQAIETEKIKEVFDQITSFIKENDKFKKI
ncbi:guanine nucleotide-binding protein g(o) subunit alpha [Anaeramoeba ignava]|uniref:Guanine nucleotide-binding protein g(O) subunit alpha n=1 Tax=Anaeramoeba ignava TaxID=1746090 RepID=A0A9Q0LJM3_ANAIG|nr:guanine nucleotide-binding protein g(o) subunit alpha [Anaeramoeba ignava]|eukprot:Anaeramoba_ignava/a223188_19.p1 GENE.a223188_19~~a223188_19.p1  ORF type:complete len:350 (-),score=130.14 a223188_19:148-1197(-)